MAIGSFLLDARSVVTLTSFITFIGIVWWAYSSRRNEAFEQAAMLPFMDDNDLSDEEKRHV